MSSSEMDTVDSKSTMAHGRLAVLTAHLAASVDPPLTFSPILDRMCVSSQSAVAPPPNLKGSLTVIDERTGKKYQIPVSEEGAVKATDFKKVNLKWVCFSCGFC